MLTALEPAPRREPRRAKADPPRPRAAWPWAVLALVLCAIALSVHVIRRKGGEVSGTYYVVESTYRTLPLHLAYPPGRIQFQDGPYDGAFFLAMANDPLLAEYEDGTRFHRGRRILLSWAAWLLGAGNPEAILYTIPLANLALVLLGTLFLARLLIENGRHPAWSLLNAVTIGTANCLIRSLADAFAVNLLLVGAWAWQKEKTRLAVILFALAGLSKEVALLVPMVLGALVAKNGGWRRAVPLAVAPAIVLGWWAIVWAGSPSSDIGRNFGLPFAGLYRVLILQNPRAAEWEGIPLAAMLVALVFALVGPLASRGPRGAWRSVALAFAVLAVFGDRGLWEEYWAYGRAFAALPAFLLVAYATGGRKIDLVGPVAVAASGAFVWGLWM